MKGESSTWLILGPWWSTLLYSGTNRPVDRALGAAATLGISIAILRLMKRALRSNIRQGEEHREQNLYPLIKGILRSLLMLNHKEEQDAIDFVKHVGACHCRSIEFELLAPRNLKAINSPGKIRYPRVRSNASNFRFSKGAELANMYYVSTDKGDDGVVAAHSFCTKCGVHILHAPRSDSDVLEVNMDCLDLTRVSRGVLRKDDNFGKCAAAYQKWKKPFPANNEVELAGGKRKIFFGSLGDESSTYPIDEQNTTPDHYTTKLKEPTTESPGTASTATTSMGTDSCVTAMRMRALALEHDSSLASIESDSISGEELSIGARSSETMGSSRLSQLTTNLPVTLESPPSTATPMMRDQLKYYMKKHLKPSASC